jgi:hypothetical protein
VARAGDGVGEVDEPDNVLIYLSVSQQKWLHPQNLWKDMWIKYVAGELEG